MCGILGIYSSENKKELINRVEHGINSLNHRGPDSKGLCNFDIKENKSSLVLGHTRLSIIDLTPNANQPMQINHGRYTIVYNGEIYNYKELREELIRNGHIFKTDSDTEVLVTLWAKLGDKGLKKIIGMFAFAIFDRLKGTLTIARDAFGIKPLYYKRYLNNIYFASELPALLKLIPTKFNLNIQRSYDYLVHNDYDSNEETIIGGVKHLKPAHTLVFNLKNLDKKKPKIWWKPNITTNDNISYEKAVKKLRKIFIESVNLNLRSDVPIGVTLSGGIDSSAIISVIRYLNPNKKLITFSFISEKKSISEEKWINFLKKKLNLNSYKIKINSNELLDDLDKLILIQGEPFGGTSIYAQFRLFKFIKKKGIKVILDGQGADEILAGYSGYPGHRLLSIVETKGLVAAHDFAQKWSKLNNKNYFLAWMYLGRLLMPDFLYQFLHKFFYEYLNNPLAKNFTPKWFRLNDLNKKISLKENRYKLKKENKGSRVKEAMAHAITGRGLQSLLRHADRNSMTSSIENRVPFLSIPLVDFLLSLPETFFYSDDGLTKNIFRDSMKGIVPNKILNRKDKIGFETPQQNWLLSNSSSIKRIIKNSTIFNFIDKELLLIEFEKVIKGKKVFTSRVWRWLNFLRWADLLPVNKSKNNQ